uniref:Phospholipid/glycerol acyltransferase domain-containing protein n=1 Tax=Timema douglasi TaxID=61478 RepID=A0A7R8VGE8_TIMDO|nr:unnamed protein product [Timema douglasi]
MAVGTIRQSASPPANWTKMPQFHHTLNSSLFPVAHIPIVQSGGYGGTTAPLNSLVTKAAKSLNVRNILLVDALSYQNGFLTRKLCHLATVWGLKKHEYPQVSPVVLRDQRLKDTIEAAAFEDCKATGETGESQFNKFKSFHENRAFKIIETMRSTMSNFLLKLTSWVLYKLLPCFLTSVVAHPAHIDMLKKASHSGLPLIFLPLHRSHLDYILISFILVNNNIKPPLVAAGNNLRIPVFGWLLRGLGAFFIKRRMDPVQGRKDTVYRAVLHTYMMACLSAGHNMEFFIEGGRTRTGKTCMPKGGLLSVIVKAYMDGIVQDALLVPVSVNYEKLVDGNFVREQLGQPKQMETFSSAIKAIWSVLNSNYGMMRIDFNQPFSLRELVESFQRRKVKLIAAPVTSDSDRAELSAPPNSDCGVIASKKQLHTAPSSTSLYGIDVVVEEHRQLVESIARHVVYDCTRAQAIMSTNAVAFLLLTKFRQGTTLELLAEALDQFRQELDWADRDLGFTGESVDVINHAVDLLGPGLIKRERHSDGAMITPVTMLPNVIELSYYSNALLSQYVIDAVLASMLLKASYLILSLLVTASMLLKASYLILSLLVTASMLLKASYLILSLLVTANMLLKASYLILSLLVTANMLLKASYLILSLLVTASMLLKASYLILSLLVTASMLLKASYLILSLLVTANMLLKASYLILSLLVTANMLLKASYLILSLLVTASMLLKASYLILSLLVTASMLLKASYLILSLLVTANMLLKASYLILSLLVTANMLLKASYLILSLLVTASMLLKASYLILSLLVTASMLLKASYLILSLLVTASMLLKASYSRPPFSSFLFYSYSKFPLLTAIYSIFLENLNGSLPSTNETVSIGQDKLIEYSLELFDILQFEFIFSKPCQYLDSLVMEAIENLKVKEILLEPEEEQWSKRFAQHLEHEFDHSDDDEPYFRVPHYQVDTSSKSMSHLEFLHTLLRSLLDVYVVSALVITRMVDRELPERELVMEVLAEMKTQLDDGDMLYGESLCVDPIKNALKLFERWEVLGCHSEDRVKSYHLKEAFDSETEVALVLDKLNRFKFPLNK